METSAKAQETPTVTSKVLTIFKLLASLSEQSLRNNEKAYQLKTRLLATPVDQAEGKVEEKETGILSRIIHQLSVVLRTMNAEEQFLVEVLEQTEE